MKDSALTTTEASVGPTEGQAVGLNSKVESPWMTAVQAATYLSVSIKTIYNLKCQGRLKAYSLGGAKGGALRFLRTDLDALFITKRKGA